MAMTTLLIFLLDWISTNTHYDKSKFDAEIMQLNDREFETMACKGKCPVLAFYLEGKGIFTRKLDFNDVCNQSILLHEIIHVFQSTENSETNFAFRESEAYKIQNAFLIDISERFELIEQLSLKKCRSNQLKKNFFF